MRLAFYDNFRPGIIQGEQIVDISGPVRALPGPLPRSLMDLIAALKDPPGALAQTLMQQIIIHFDDLAPDLNKLAKNGKGTPLRQVRLRPPLPSPAKILCCLLNYKEGLTKPQRPPGLFLKPSSTIIGNEETVVLPHVPAPIFHHEAELAVVMKGPTKGVGKEEALRSVFGYTNFMDLSARKVLTGSSFMNKAFDTFGPMGPAIVTADEVPDPQKLQIKLWVNGDPRHNYCTDDMENDVRSLVAFASSICTLHPGDLISTGTNHQGIGAIQDGDRVDMEIKDFGRLTVFVTDPEKRSWPRAIDKTYADWVKTL